VRDRTTPTGGHDRWSAYRSEAIDHAREFIDLALTRSRIDRLQHLLETRERCVAFLHWTRDQEIAVTDLVRAGPFRRADTLRLASAGDRDTRLGLVLASYQFCRRAVLTFEWLRMRPPPDWQPTLGARDATVAAGRLFPKLPRRPWRMWPPQWGVSPFINDRHFVGERENDFILELDTYDPWLRADRGGATRDATAVGPPWQVVDEVPDPA
jgi:hypothetical protein